MRYLFWNTNQKNVNHQLLDLMKEYDPTIIALAEYRDDVKNLLSEIKQDADKKYIEVAPLACRIKIIIKTSIDKVLPCNDSTYYTIKEIPYNSLNQSHYVVFVHLPSKLYDTEDKKKHILKEISDHINVLDFEIDRKVVIMGDFNSNPYELPMTSLYGCNAVSSKVVATRIAKNLPSEKRKVRYYYNPMWNYLGDESPNFGTYYYDKSSGHSNYWNTFDQFVVSPALISDINDIKVIRKTQKDTLCNAQGIPCVSDHLPLYFRLGGK